ncbi:unnamed protein product [Lymnaea stagnalis]|uniref:Smr domain-containing protein n=1 Tax=Lymnaea stagnalis TaxID=6523 RepID=A0AAV2IEJ7_LYMST
MADIEELIVIRKLKLVLNILVVSVSIGIYIVNSSTAADVEDVHDNDKKASNTLDLRGLTVEVAREEVEKFLLTKQQAYKSGGQRKYDRVVYINTGWGKGGSKVTSIIFEVIDGFLTKNGFNFKWINVGEARIDLFYSK